jgi:hydroxymethylbilane synthase
VIRLGTRGSALALAQARWVAERLPGEVQIVSITTSGDERRGASPEVADKSRFVKEIEEALLAGEIDLAVHSAKDVPAEIPRGLIIAGVPERADPRDALCGADSLDDLREGAVVGTASLRRRAALLALRPDLDVRELRGNVDTRLRRLEDGEFDALVLAQAGLERLGRERQGSPLDPDSFVPAPGQGCLILEARDADPPGPGIHALTDGAATECLLLERTVVRRLGASCHTPIGVYATGSGDRFRLTAFVGLPDGSKWIRDDLRSPDDAVSDALGLWVADRLLAAGAAELLAEAERALAAG